MQGMVAWKGIQDHSSKRSNVIWPAELRRRLRLFLRPTENFSFYLWTAGFFGPGRKIGRDGTILATLRQGF